MGPLLWIALLGAFVVGMCAGAATTRDYSRGYLARAKSAEAALRALHDEREAPQRPPQPPAAAVSQPPVIVNLHLSAAPQHWPSVLDGQVVAELPRGG